ncbi:MAG: DegV family protein [Eubacterium sp.]|nr:DegV family protein [Eubacterium sp.]
MHTGVVTDTNSGMSVREGQERGIYVLAMPVIVDGKVYHEGQDVSFQELFQAMEAEKQVSTSSPSPLELQEVWDRAFADGCDELVYIPMSSGLSSSCEQAKLLAEQYDGRVYVADNHRISLTQYESVLDAKAMADNGKSAAEIKERLEDNTYGATIYLTVDSLDYLRKSGRITAAAHALAALLKIRPILTIQGEKIDAFAKARGIRSAMRKMIEATAQDLREKFQEIPKKKILIGAAGTLVRQEDIDQWSERVRAAFPGYTFLYHPLSCSVACHTGPGAVGTGFVIMDRVAAD